MTDELKRDPQEPGETSKTGGEGDRCCSPSCCGTAEAKGGVDAG